MSCREDLAILNSVFNPLVPLGECPVDDIVDENLKDEEEESTPSVEQCKALELEAVTIAESGHVTEAIDLLSRAIQVTPRRASCYNNRAQAYRLIFDHAAALQDLNTAIELSRGRGRTACLAHLQRAFIYRYLQKEKEAVADFTIAKDLGSSLARSMLVQMNPYSALCNQMLRKVMQQYQTGQPSTNGTT